MFASQIASVARRAALAAVSLAALASSVHAAVGSHSSIAVIGGTNFISYYDIGNANLLYREGAPGAWAGVMVVDAPGSVGQYTSVKVASPTDRHISYYDATNGNLKYAHGVGAWPPAWAVAVIDAPGNVGLYSSLALNPVTGNPAIAYYDASNGNLKLAEFGGGAWALAVVDAPGNVGQYCSLAFDPAGNPQIAYYDVTNSALKYATRVAGAWVIATLDAPGVVGQYTSIVDIAGLPRIAYYDATNTNLKFASLSPAGVWTLAMLDGGGFACGQFTSIGATPLGDCRIAYYDATGTRLRAISQVAGVWGAPVVIDPGPNVGQFTALACDGGGDANVTYYRAGGADDLMFVEQAAGVWGLPWVADAAAPVRGGSAMQTTSVGSQRPSVPSLAVRAMDNELQVSLALPEAATVDLVLLDVAGRVAAQRAAEHLEAGTHAMSFDTHSLARGGYIVLARGGGATLATARTVVMR